MNTDEKIAELDLGDVTSKSPYLKWRDRFMADYQVTTHYAPHCEELGEPGWSAFRFGFEHLAQYCSVMEERDEMRFGPTERDALELLALAVGAPLSFENEDLSNDN